MMGNSQQVMPKVDFEADEKLKVAHSYSKYLEEKNSERVLVAKKLLKRKRIVGGLMFTTVFAIYAFTILRVKQETFLDDFEEPPRIIKDNMKDLIRLSPLPTISELLKLYQLRALKRLSQNFLLNLKVTNKIVKCAGKIKGCEVCEIGPGPGGITRSILMKQPTKVIAIEKDKRFQPMLEALVSTSGGKLQVNYCDAIDYDLSQSFDSSLRKDWHDKPPDIHLIGNLPFNVGNIILFKYLKDISLRRNAWSYGRVRLTLTFQEEVAQRMTSQILSKQRCRMSVMVQNWCHVSHALTVKGTAFLPKPKVNVGVVHLEPLKEPIIPLEFHLVERFLRVMFNSRQKFSYNTAEKLFPEELRDDLTPQLFHQADVDPKLRPFQISNQEWRRLCMTYKEICDQNPKLYQYNFRGNRRHREEEWKKDRNEENEENYYCDNDDDLDVQVEN